jgi:hypothetical protein
LILLFSRYSSPSAPPSVVLELRLDSGFAADAYYLCRWVLGSEGTAAPTSAGPARLHAAGVCSTRRRYFQYTLFSTNGRNYCGFVIILYSNRTGRPPPSPTAGPRQQPPPPMYTLGGSIKPAFQFPATDIPSSSTPPMFQAQPSTLDMAAEDQLAWDEIRYDDILATMEGAPQ